MLSRFAQKRAFSQVTVPSLTAPGQTYTVRNQLFINGQWQDSKSGKTFDTVNPGTGEVITKVQSGGPEDIELAVQAAKQAAQIWEHVPQFVRGSLLNKFADKIEQHADELVTLECEDNGKQYADAMGDCHFSAMLMRYYGGLAMNISGQAMMRDNYGVYNNSYAYTRKEPVGLCGLITPWNYPMLMTAFKIGPMLASGCTGVHKTPELTPLSSLRMIELWHEIEGVVPGVINAVPGIGMEAGEALVDHPEIRKIAFTGSTATGKRIQERAAKTMKRVTLELGGKGPLVVFGDADLQKAIETAAQWSIVNSGQMCAAATRLIVEESVYDEFLEGLQAAYAKQTMGYWREGQFSKGPVISQNQLDKILGYIEAGKAEGARLVAGGSRIDRKGYFVEPTIFADCHRDMKIVREEIFGPVVTVQKFKSGDNCVEEALSIANDSPYGLMGGVFSQDKSKANQVVRKMQCGIVNNNSYGGIFYDSPFGGYKESGVGRELSTSSIENFLETKTVIVDCSTP